MRNNIQVSSVSRLGSRVSGSIEYHGDPLRDENGVVSVDDLGRVRRKIDVRDFKGSVSPVGRNDKSFFGIPEHRIDDSVVKSVDDGMGGTPRFAVYKNDFHSVLSFLVRWGALFMLTRKSVSGGGDQRESNVPLGYKVFHKKMIERLSVPVVARGEDVSGLFVPFIVFNELDADPEDRYQVDTNSRVMIPVEYHIFSRKNQSTDILEKFESILYDKVFWGEGITVQVDKEAGKVNELVDNGTGEFWEKNIYTLKYFYEKENQFEEEYEPMTSASFNIGRLG